METTLQSNFAESVRVPVAQVGSRAQPMVGRVLSGLAIAFLTFDAVMKLLELDVVREGTLELGYPVETAFWLGVVLLVSLLVHVVPRTRCKRSATRVLSARALESDVDATKEVSWSEQAQRSGPSGWSVGRIAG